VFVIGIIAGIVVAVPVGLLVHSRAVLFGAAVIVWVKVVSRAKLSSLGVSPSPLRDVATGLVGGLVLTFVALVASFVVVTALTAITGHTPHQPDQIPRYVTGASLVISGVLVVLAAPFGEELLFRGFLYNALRRKWATWPSALVSGVLFALLHGAPILILAIFPVGVGLALIYERRHSIVASMAAHATFNLIGFITILLGRR
jgi:membrane protease YdiL (CAAX protease family)